MNQTRPQGSRHLRLIALILLGILALLVSVSWLWLESTAFDRWLRTRIIDTLEDRFPVSVSLDRARLEILGGTVELENFRLRNRINRTDPPAIEIGRARLNFSLFRILQEGFHLDALFVSGLRVNLVEDPNGKLNIQNIFLRSDTEMVEEGSRDSGFPWTLQIGRVQVKTGMIDYQNERVVFDSRDGALTFSLQYKKEVEAYSGDLTLSDFLMSIDQFTLPVTGVLAQFTLTEDQLELSQLNLKGPSVDARLTGSIRNFTAPKYDFELDLQANLADLTTFDVEDHVEQGSIQITGQLEGATTKPILSGTVTAPIVQVQGFPFKNLNGDFSLDRTGLSLPELTLNLLDGSGTAKGQVHWSEDQSSEFRVHMEKIDLSSVLPYASLENVSLTGSMDTELAVSWPGMSVNEIELSADYGLQGTVLEQGPYDSVLHKSALPFEAAGKFSYGNDTIELSAGHLTTENTEIDFSAGIMGNGATELSATITSQSAQELSDLAARFTVPWEEFQHQFDVAVSGQVRADVEMQSHPAGPTTLDAPFQIQRVEMAGHSLGSVSGAVHLDADQIRFESIELTHPEFELSGSAWLDRALPTEIFGVETSLSKFPSAVLFDIVRWEPYIDCLASGHFSLSRAELGGFSGDGSIKLTDIEVPALPTDTVKGVSTRLSLNNGKLRLEDTVLSSPLGEIRGFLEYALESGSFSTRFDGTELALSELSFLASLPIQGNLNLAVRGKGSIDNPEISITADSEVLHIADYSLQGFQLNCVPEAGLNRFSIGGSFLDQPFELAGTVEPSTPFPFKAQLILSDTPLSPYLALLEETEISGIEAFVTGLIQAEGTLKELSELQLRGDLQDLRLRFRDYEFSTAEPVTITFADGSVQVPSMHFTGNDTDLRVQGRLNLKEQASVNLKLAGNSNLGLLNVALGEASVEGRLDLETDITGPLDSPQIVGTATLSQTRFVHGDLPISFWNIEGTLKFTPAQLSLESLVADTELGRIHLEGGVFLESFAPQRWQIRATGTGLQVEYPPDITSIFDMNLNLVKALGTQLISGEVNLRSTEFTENISLAELVLELAQPVPTRQRESEQEEIALDIAIAGNRSLRVENNLGDITASANLSMIGTVANPVILGSISIDEGVLYLEGNDFDINRGTVSFSDPYKTSPFFNFEARTTIREYEIIASVRGPTDRIRASFSSDPPLSTAGVVSLLATGQTSEEIFGGGTTGQTDSGALALYGAGALLSRTLGSELQSQTSKFFGLQRFSIDPFIDSGRDRDPGAKITLGAQLSKNVNVTYVSSLGRELLGQTVVVQYRLTNWVTLVGTSDSEGSLAIDIKFRNRF